jgi:hypothetical protein
MRLLITGITIPFEQTLADLLEYWRQRIPARSR